MKKFLLFIAGVIVLGTAAHAATVCFPFQGCTGTSTTPLLGNVLIGNSSGTYTVGKIVAGSNVTVSTSTPGQISISSNGGSGGSATTTINGVSGPAFTFSTTTASGVWNITNPSGSIIRWTLPSNVGFFTNDAGYITATTTPGGSNTQVQFNDGGVFGGDANFTWGKGVSGGLSVTTHDGAIDPESIGGRIDFFTGNGGDNIAQYYTGAQFSISGGNGDDQEGGSVGFVGGNSTIDGEGGSVSFEAGDGGTVSGSGGAVSLSAGNAQGGDGDGGPIIIQAGEGTGSGAQGFIQLIGGGGEDNQIFIAPGDGGVGLKSNGGDNAAFDTSTLTDDRTYSFPDQSGVIGVFDFDPGFTQLKIASSTLAWHFPGNNNFSLVNSTDGYQVNFDITGTTNTPTLTAPNESGSIGLGTGTANSIAIWSTTSTLAAASSSTLRTATGLSATAPLSYSSATGVFSCPTCGAGTLTGNGTATWIPFYNTATELISVSGLTYASSTGMFSAPSSTITNSTTTNHIVTTKLQIPTNQTLAKGGEISVKTTSSTLNFHDGTAERVLNPERCFAPSWVIENPTASEDIPIMVFNASSTITKARAVNKTHGDTVTFNLGFGPSRATVTGSLNKTFTSNQAVTATTTISLLSVNGSSTVSTGDILRFFTSAASSTQFALDVCWKEIP